MTGNSSKLIERVLAVCFCFHVKGTHCPLCDWTQMAESTVGQWSKSWNLHAAEMWNKVRINLLLPGGGGMVGCLFVCSAAKQTCTLVNGQHQICLMERLRNHARTCMQPNWLISITMNHKGAYKTICSLHFHYQQNQQCSAAANRGKRALILWMWWLQPLEFCLHQNGLIKLTVLKLKWRGDLKLSWGGIQSPSGYSQWKMSHLWSHDSSLHCALTSAFTLITTQLMAQNRENREAHYCSSGLLAGLFIFYFFWHRRLQNIPEINVAGFVVCTPTAWLSDSKRWLIR